MESRVRRPPPPLRRVELRAVERRTPRMVRVTVGGPELDGLVVEAPAASVRLLLPTEGDDGLVVPEWTGNEFLRPDGSRPVLRTLTPRYRDVATDELVLDIVDHGDGAAATWATTAPVGAPAAISGPGRGYEIDAATPHHVLAGDETAVPAMSQLLEHLPSTTTVEVLVEAASAEAEHPLPDHPGASVRWVVLDGGAAHGDALVDALASTDPPDEARWWVAGEAAAVQRIRRLLFEDRGVDRGRATVRGYWKQGRRGD